MNYKKILLIIILSIMILGIAVIVLKSGHTKKDLEKIQIVASNFASYDFLRAIIGDNDNIELTYLLGAGKDSHSYEPTAQDLIKIKNSKLFVYIGGETENWIDKVLDSTQISEENLMCITDYVETIQEQEIDGAENEKEEEEEGAFDDHIWTSPSNAVMMVNVLENKMETIDTENKNKYKENADNYIAQINAVDKEIRQIVDNKKRDRLIFGDRMPMQYFISYYGLNVSSAFSGCSTDVDPSASTISYLEDKVKAERIPVVFYIELNNGRVAQTIAQEAGENCEALQIQTMHNVSIDDFNNGETWVSLMRRNEEPLKKALCE